MRTLKFHEKRLLRKVDFVQWKHERNVREIKILRRYMIQDREDYVKYNKLCGMFTKIAKKIKELPEGSAFRMRVTEEVLEKAHAAGLIDRTKSLHQIEKLSTSAFCRRRLPVVLVRLKMAETLKAATTFIEGGHIRVGPEIIRDPAFIVTRSMEDFVTWTDTSKIRATVAKYSDKLDDFELLGE